MRGVLKEGCVKGLQSGDSGEVIFFGFEGEVDGGGSSEVVGEEGFDFLLVVLVLEEHFGDFVGYDEVGGIVFDFFYDDVIFEVSLDGRFGELGEDGWSEVWGCRGGFSRCAVSYVVMCRPCPASRDRVRACWLFVIWMGRCNGFVIRTH